MAQALKSTLVLSAYQGLENLAASSEVNVLKILGSDVSTFLKVTLTFEAPGISSQLGTHQVSINLD